MTVYCDECCKPLSANDDSIYTENGGAMCAECRQSPVTSVNYVIEVQVKKININQRGIVLTTVIDLPFRSVIARETREDALHTATLACQHLLQVDDS